MRRVAMELRRDRADLMGAAAAAGGKLLAESDPEVSEAIDFCEFYAAMARWYADVPGLEVCGRGVVVVVSPWNFPIAIPCGGIAAALSAGNTVILKPASHTVLVAHLMCECFYRAGVPRTALQLLPCHGRTTGQELVIHPDVDTVVLTGGTSTARQMLAARPDLRLFAETGGKNATIITALADRDQAIKHVLHSAFSHSGQKCSATSLLLLEQEIYDDPAFRETLVDAASSLAVGGVWDPQTRIGPLIARPSGDLEQGLKVLEQGESWALMPEPQADNPQLYSPGIKWDVEPGSFTHHTELFGPVLGVMAFRGLSEAIHLVNQTGYGLTSGLESLDDREQSEWLAGIRAGNLYINRPTTGAIVMRQPFGGLGLSAVGPGIKAGGPNYVVPLMRIHSTGHPSGDGTIINPELAEFAREIDEPRSDRAAVCPVSLQKVPPDRLVIPDEQRAAIRRAITSYDYQARQEFLLEHDAFRYLGQDNLRRYLPVDGLCLRLTAEDTWFEVFARAAAARSVGCRMVVSAPPGVATSQLALLHELTDSWGGAIEFVEQTDDELAQQIADQELGRLRYAGADRVPIAIREAANEQLLYIADHPVLDEGRVELLWYVSEQSISMNYHRYGNLGARANEARREPV
jgi:RHH-type proline utilization regulon transcriptional repressor/proline dehydrogenase/delta 1-pyrroline-5-carboxylate dehydrogenase